MFGYVKVNSGELRVKEYEMYRGAYCGLCRSMGKCTGQCSRMSLSYDFVFLVMARIALTDTQACFKPRRCLAHPLHKRSVMERNEQLDICAYAAALLSYHKTRDDLLDEKGLKKMRARLTYPFVRLWRKKALKNGMSELDALVAEKLARLTELEQRKLPSVDEPAKLFGEILGLICEYGLDGKQRRIAYALGESVGRWLYIIDALDDVTEDASHGRFNPILLLYGGELPTCEQLDLIYDSLKLELLGAEGAMDLLDTDLIFVKNIIENILYLGMPDTAKKVTDKRKEELIND